MKTLAPLFFALLSACTAAPSDAWDLETLASAADGGTITTNDGIRVDIPAEAFVDTAGLTYEGPVEVGVQLDALDTQARKGARPKKLTVLFEGSSGALQLNNAIHLSIPGALIGSPRGVDWDELVVDPTPIHGAQEASDSKDGNAITVLVDPNGSLVDPTSGARTLHGTGGGDSSGPGGFEK